MAISRSALRRWPALLAAAACVVLLGCGRPSRPGAAAGDAPASVLRISQRNEPTDLDPARASLPDDFFIIRALGEGLLKPAPNGTEPLPGVAERYGVSADGLTYTFHLRADARWSDGDPVTAQDFIASFRRALDPATQSPKADLFFAVKNARAFAAGTVDDFSAVGFQALDDRSLVVTLEAPSPAFPDYVASGPWIPVPPDVVARHGRQWTQPEHHVGNGPFRLVEWRSQQRIVVRRNPLYHAAAEVGVDEIQFLRFDSADTEERAFRAGQVDVTMSVPLAKLAGYAREQPSPLVQTLLAETRFLTFNLRRPALADPRTRRALSLAIDRERIVDRILMGGQEPAARFVPPGLREATETLPETALHLFDPEPARRLLADAGFPGGAGFPRLELTAWSSSQVPVLEAIQEMWRQELGISVTIAVREAKTHLAALRTGDYDIAFITTLLEVLDTGALLAGFVSNAPENFPHWQDSAYDELLRGTGVAPQQAVREPVWQAAELRLLEAAPIAPVYFNARNCLVSPRVRGWQDDPLWTRFYTHVRIDPRPGTSGRPGRP